MNDENYLTLARMAAKGSNHRDAQKYWSLVLEGNPQNVEAWIGKATAVSWESNFFGEGVKEAASSLEQAVELGLTDDKLRAQAASSAYLLAEEFFDRASSQYLRLTAQADSLNRRVILELTCQMTGAELIRLAWGIEKSSDRAKALIKVCNAHRKRFGRQAGDFVDHVIQDCQNWVTKNDPGAAQTLPRAASKPACFIATASYGTQHDPRVISLQEFRDKWLLRRSSGRFLVNVYYRLGPPFARLIGRSMCLQALSRTFLIFPVYTISKFLMTRQALPAEQARPLHDELEG